AGVQPLPAGRGDHRDWVDQGYLGRNKPGRSQCDARMRRREGGRAARQGKAVGLAEHEAGVERQEEIEDTRAAGDRDRTAPDAEPGEGLVESDAGWVPQRRERIVAVLGEARDTACRDQ